MTTKQEMILWMIILGTLYILYMLWPIIRGLE